MNEEYPGIREEDTNGHRGMVPSGHPVSRLMPSHSFLSIALKERLGRIQDTLWWGRGGVVGMVGMLC